MTIEIMNILMSDIMEKIQRLFNEINGLSQPIRDTLILQIIQNHSFKFGEWEVSIKNHEDAHALFFNNRNDNHGVLILWDGGMKLL